MFGRSESALRQGFCSAKMLVRRRSGGSLALAEHPGIYSVGQSQRKIAARTVCWLWLKGRDLDVQDVLDGDPFSSQQD